MQTKYGIIKKSELQDERFPECFKNNWQTVNRSDGEFLCIHAFAHYIQEDDFLHVFYSEEELETWKNEAIDKRIERVEYDWENDTCLITIKQGTTHAFSLKTDSNWSIEDCKAAIEQLNL